MKTVISALAVSVIASIALAHDHHEHKTSGSEESIDATGVVFDDANGNGQRDSGEAGLEDVGVSNGRIIVRTDSDGRYSLKISDDAIIFVIKPRGWSTPVNKDNLPQFFYIHKPAGSPESKFAGVEPTGPLPESIDFPLQRSDEPDQFRALMFGDPQPRNVKEVEYIAHDVIEQIVGENAHGASLGVTLGDIVFDDLDVMKPLNQAIALIGIPWYNVIGNHDINLDAADDAGSDETFERVYGPAYYSFNHGPVHFMVLDDVMWVGGKDGGPGKYHGGLGPRQMEFIRNDLASIPDEQLVVLLMHIPLIGVKDRQELYRLIEKRPFAVSLSAHTHYMEHRFIGEEDGWQGKQRHHHIINVTVCGSWWRGAPDERGLPHATMSDGGPNGYSIMTFDGTDYGLEFRAASRPAGYQMNLYAPEVISRSSDEAGEAPSADAASPPKLIANVFNGSERCECVFRIGKTSPWKPMRRIDGKDPAFLATVEIENALKDKPWTKLPGVHTTPHLWTVDLPSELPVGTHLIEVKATDQFGKTHLGRRIIRFQ